MAYDTAANIINRAARQVGLAPLSDPFGSSEPNFIQLCEFLTTAGEDLLRRYNWGHLVKEGTWVSTAAQIIQALPADFHALLGDTLWDRSGTQPGDGPVGLIPQRSAGPAAGP